MMKKNYIKMFTIVFYCYIKFRLTIRNNLREQKILLQGKSPLQTTKRPKDSTFALSRDVDGSVT